MKNKLLRKIFIIPSIIWFVLTVIVMVTSQNDPEPLTLGELIIMDSILIFIWFIIIYIISIIINLFNKGKDIDEKEIKNISSKNEEVINIKNYNTKNKDILYTCNCVIDAYECKLMFPYFREIYWTYIIKKGLFINSIVCIIYIIILGRYLLFVLPLFIILQLILMIYYNINIDKVIEKDFKKLDSKVNIDNNYIIDFYNDHLIRRNRLDIIKLNYKDVIRSVETDTNFYLESLEKNVIIIQKNECSLELVNFIRDKLKELEKDLGNIARLKKVKKRFHPDLIRIIMIFLFVITIASLWGALYTLMLINNVLPQHGSGFVRNMWVFWCWLPIPILSIILGFKYKKRGIKCTKNIVGGFIIGLLLLLYGSFCMVPTLSEDYNKIYEYEDIIQAEIPSKGYLEIQKWDSYVDTDKTDYVFISAYYDNTNIDELEKSIENNDEWIFSNDLKSELKIFIPSHVIIDTDTYLSIYNKTTDQYNVVPEITGIYEIYVMKYNISDKKLEIHKFKYNYKN